MTAATLEDPRHLYHRTWWALILRGLLALGIGVFIAARPLDSIAALALVIALWALFSGLVDIIHSVQLKPLITHWWLLLLSGLIGIGFGIAALMFYPILSLTFAVVWIGWWPALTGVLGIYIAFRHRMLGLAWGWTAVFSVLCIVLAGLLVFWAPITLVALMALIAGFAILTGIVLIGAGLRLRSAGML